MYNHLIIYPSTININSIISQAEITEKQKNLANKYYLRLLYVCHLLNRSYYQENSAKAINYDWLESTTGGASFRFILSVLLHSNTIQRFRNKHSYYYTLPEQHLNQMPWVEFLSYDLTLWKNVYTPIYLSADFDFKKLVENMQQHFGVSTTPAIATDSSLSEFWMEFVNLCSVEPFQSFKKIYNWNIMVLKVSDLLVGNFLGFSEMPDLIMDSIQNKELIIEYIEKKKNEKVICGI